MAAAAAAASTSSLSFEIVPPSSFYCNVCRHTYLVECLNGGRETFVQHKAFTHLSCMKCCRQFTSNREEEHNNSYHPHVCQYCNRRFTAVNQLKSHISSSHGLSIPCILCGLNDEFEPIRVFSCKNELNIHTRLEHPGEQPYICPQTRVCKEVFKHESELERHILMHHKYQCIYCPATIIKGGSGLDRDTRQYPAHRSLNQLRQHIAVSHNDNRCFYCGQLFKNKDELYIHQKDRCMTTYTCSACNKRFANVTSLNSHSAEHVSALGACSTSSYPSHTQTSHTWHALKHKYKPWDRDVQKLFGTGLLQNKIEKEYKARRQRTPPSSYNINNEINLRREAKEHIINQHSNL